MPTSRHSVAERAPIAYDPVLMCLAMNGEPATVAAFMHLCIAAQRDGNDGVFSERLCFIAESLGYKCPEFVGLVSKLQTWGVVELPADGGLVIPKFESWVSREAKRESWRMWFDAPNAPRKGRKRRPKNATVQAKTRWAVLKRDGYKCAYCGVSASSGAVLHVDHIVPVAKGGTNATNNLKTACALCNFGKGVQLV